MMLAILSSVAATPLPTPSPVLLQPQITQVFQTPAAVVQLFQLFAVMAAGALTSLLHLALERGKLKGNVNRLIVTLYSSGAGMLYMALTGHLGLHISDLETGLTALLAFLGTNQGTKMVSDFIGSVFTSQTTTDASGAQVFNETTAP